MGIGFPAGISNVRPRPGNILSQPFDIHCGGIDHVPVHHENEIAQSEASHGVPLAKVWMHTEFPVDRWADDVQVAGRISTRCAISPKGLDPMALRLFYLGAHYRQSRISPLRRSRRRRTRS